MTRKHKKKQSIQPEVYMIISAAVLFGVFLLIQELRKLDTFTAVLIGLSILTPLILVSCWIISRKLTARKADRAFSMAKVDRMGGIEFEHFLAKVLKSRGYKNVSVTSGNDLGIDVLATKDGVRWGIQAKRYRKNVKVDAVRQAYSALNTYKCDRAMVVTNSTYSDSAKRLAKDTGCVLVGRKELKKWIYESSSS